MTSVLLYGTFFDKKSIDEIDNFLVIRHNFPYLTIEFEYRIAEVLVVVILDDIKRNSLRLIKILYIDHV